MKKVLGAVFSILSISLLGLSIYAVNRDRPYVEDGKALSGSLNFSTYVGTTSQDTGRDVAVDNQGNIYDIVFFF